MARPVVEAAVQSAIRACYAPSGDLEGVRSRLLPALSRVVPFDAVFMAGADPETLLFTGVFADDTLRASGPLFLDNEFGAQRDVNRFADLARSDDPVASLDAVTKSDRTASVRWREIMEPLGMGDELRGALRVDHTTWGFLCLHRAGAVGFTAAEMAILRKIAPHAGEAIRRVAAANIGGATGAAQAVILVVDHLVVAIGGAVDQIEGGSLEVGRPPPLALAALVHRLEAIESGDGLSGAGLPGGDAAGWDGPPAVSRMTTRSGALVTVHAARLRDASGAGPVVLTVTPASSAERAAMLLAAYGLTPAQCRVADLVLQGLTTGQIVVELRISAHTVQDHLKVVFDKVGVRSRRELVSALMQPR